MTRSVSPRTRVVAKECLRTWAVVSSSRPASTVEALSRFTEDGDPGVRDWATFGLGVLLDVDSPAVRSVLRARVDDPEGDTAGEAIVALARRRDREVASVIAGLLEDPMVGNLIVEAAAELADPAFLPALRRLKAAGWELGDPRPDWLDLAITACQPEAADDEAECERS